MMVRKPKRKIRGEGETRQVGGGENCWNDVQRGREAPPEGKGHFNFLQGKRREREVN